MNRKQLDAAIRAALRKRGVEFEPGVSSGPVKGLTFEDLRTVAIVGMLAAAKVKHENYDRWPFSDMRSGHLWHQSAIRADVRKLKRVMR